jgi:uncharacterized protein (DUF983 family)
VLSHPLKQTNHGTGVIDMELSKSYDNYPLSTVIQSNLVSFGIYACGFLILLKLGLIFSSLFLISIFLFELRLIRSHCPNCYYWGKTCGFGKGRLSAAFFTQGDKTKFCGTKMTWRDMIPDILLSLVPFVVGIVFVIVDFSFLMLATLLILVLLTTAGNGYIRGTKTCSFCKQRETGCPAFEMFNKGKQQTSPQLSNS